MEQYFRNADLLLHNAVVSTWSFNINYAVRPKLSNLCNDYQFLELKLSPCGSVVVNISTKLKNHASENFFFMRNFRRSLLQEELLMGPLLQP